MHIDIEALSGIFGSISIACWVVVFSPQIIENFRRSSAEGLSIVFIVIWLVGDIFNFIGAVLQGLLPTMIILAVYYTLADIVLMLQCFYYRGFTLKDNVQQDTSHSTRDSSLEEPTERSALLSHPTNGTASPGTAAASNPLAQTTSRRSSFRDHLNSLDGTHLSPATPLHPKNRDKSALKAQSPVQKNQPLWKSILFNLTAIIVVCAAGVLGWWLSTRGPVHAHDDGGAARSVPYLDLLRPGRPANEMRHHHHGHEKGDRQKSDLEFNVAGQVFGYLCAISYLGSRVPQLLLNYRRKSTEGISMLFFLFACMGNAAYVLSIMAYEPSCYSSKLHLDKTGCQPGEAGRQYLRNFLVNFSWLLGSFGTLLMDAAVFLQWYWYRENNSQHGNNDDANDVAVEGAEDVRR